MASPFFENYEDAASKQSQRDDVTSEAQRERILPLHDACSDGDEQKAFELIRQGADVNAKDRDGKTPLNNALEGKHEKLAIALIQNDAEFEYNVQFLHLAIKDSLLNFTTFLVERNAYVRSIYSNGETPLHIAASKGYLELTRLFVEKGSDVNHASRQGETPLHHASYYGHTNIASVLIEHGAIVNARDNVMDTPLQHVATKGRIELASLLIEKGAEVNDANKEGETPLHRASGNGHRDVARLLIELGSNVDVRNCFGETPLQHAASKGYGKLARLLIEEGADVNAINLKRETPLLKATADGHKNVALLLLKNGADVNGAKEVEVTPLHLAASHGYTELARLLLENGADVNAIDSKGATALYHAATNGNADLVRLLVTMGGDVNTANSSGETPLLQLATNGHAEFIKLLIDTETDEIERDPNSISALLRAASCNNRLVVAQILLENGADVNAKYKNMDGDTPLHRAVYNRDLIITTFLVKNGAIVDSVNDKGNTPLHLAAGGGHQEMARYLVKHGAHVHAINKGGDTPLHIAVTSNFIAMVDTLIAVGANVNATDATGKTALHLAVKGEYQERADGNLHTTLHLIVKLLVQKGADINALDKKGRTPLQYSNSNLKMNLILQGESSKESPSLRTVETTHIPIEYSSFQYKPLKLDSLHLFKGGNKPTTSLESENMIKQLKNEIRDLQNPRMLDKSINKYVKEELSKLKVKQINIPITENVELSDITENINVVKGLEMLQERKKSFISASNNDDGKPTGRMTLNETAHKGDFISSPIALVGRLPLDTRTPECLGNRPRINISGRNPVLDEPMTVGSCVSTINVSFDDINLSIEHRLASLDDDVNARDSNQDTPLHVAAKVGHVQEAEYLIKKGSNINAVNLSNKTPLSLASENGHREVKMLLFEHGAHLYVPEINIPVEEEKSETPQMVPNQAELVELVWKDIERLQSQFSDTVANQRHLVEKLKRVETAYEELQSSFHTDSNQNVSVLYNGHCVASNSGYAYEIAQDSMATSEPESSVYRKDNNLTMLSLLILPPLLIVSALLYSRLKK